MNQCLLSLRPGYFERIWGGTRLRDTFGLPAPAGKPIGEAWLVSDHESFESEVLNGAWRGRTLHQVLESAPAHLLGSIARPTVHGRFPLLLKILDAADVLSVQVHPDDEAARLLGEPDVGKTEMWHVLDAEPDSTLICGLDPSLTRDGFLAAAAAGTIEQSMRRFPAPPGTTVFVAAGTVHAIGAGILLAEIQQNSDLTYRIHDWNRVDASGTPRTLHLEKAARVTHFGSAFGGPATALDFEGHDGPRTILGACGYFAGERYAVTDQRIRTTAGRSFHLLLVAEGRVAVTAGPDSVDLDRGAAVLVAAGAEKYHLRGAGIVLDYYVPDLASDIVAPLRAAGHSDAAIGALDGGQAGSGLAWALRA